LVNPTRSKVKRERAGDGMLLRERLRAARPMLAGRPHEAAGNGSPIWMAAGPRKRAHRTWPGGRVAPGLPGAPRKVRAPQGMVVGNADPG
jgi:hypothetical protein